MDWITSDDQIEDMTAGKTDIIKGWSCDDTAGEFVWRIDLGNGFCGWAKLYGSKWSLLAVAPVGDVFDQDVVHMDDMFATRWPATWICAKSAAAKQKIKALPVKAGDWIAGRVGSGTSYLAKCVEAVDGQPTVLRLSADIGDMPASQLSVKRWFSVTNRDAGCEWMSLRGKFEFHNYKLMLMQLANADKKTIKIRAKASRGGFAAVVGSQQASEAQNAPEALKNADMEPLTEDDEPVALTKREVEGFVATARGIASRRDPKDKPAVVVGYHSFVSTYDMLIDIGYDEVEAFRAAEQARDAAIARFNASDMGQKMLSANSSWWAPEIAENYLRNSK